MIKRLPRRLRFILIFVMGTFAFCVVGLYGCAMLYQQGWENADLRGCLGETPYQNSTIERGGRFKFPSSARNIVASSRGIQDCGVYIQFDMDAADLGTFLASTKYVASAVPSVYYATFPTATSFDEEFFTLSEVSKDWNLETNKTYLYGHGGNDLYGHGSNESYESQVVVIDTSNPEHYIVYVLMILL